MFLVIIKSSRFIENNDLEIKVDSVLKLKQLMTLLIHDYDYCIVDNSLDLVTGQRILVLDYLDTVYEENKISKIQIKDNFDKYCKSLIRKKDITYNHIKIITKNTENIDNLLDEIDDYTIYIKEKDNTKLFFTGQDICDEDIDMTTSRIDILQFGTITASNIIVKNMCKIINNNNINLTSFEIC